MLFAPLQILDSFLLNYNVGDALLLVFVLGLLATLPKHSRKLTTIHVILFGAVFLLTPSSMLAVDPGGSHLLASSFQYKMVGIVLLATGPVVYASANH